MYQNIYYGFFVISLIWLLYKKQEFIIWLPLFYVILESGFSFFSTLSILTFIRPIVFFFMFLYFIRSFVISGLTKNILYFLSYSFLLIFLSTEILYSLKGYTQVFISMMCFPLGYIYFNSYLKIQALNKTFLYIILFSVISSVIGYIFGIGKSFDYDVTMEESVGILGSSGLYSAAIGIGILPFLFKTNENRFVRWILFISSLVVYIFILLNVRRTAIFIPIVGLLTYALFTPKKSKVINGIIIGSAIILLSSPLYIDKLITRYNVRANKGRFDEDFYKTEMRYIENVQLVEELYQFEEPVRIIFGVGNNIFAENISDSQKARRMYHTDVAKLVSGVGLMGFFLYLLIYLKLFKLIKNVPNKKEFLEYKATAWGLFFISVFVSLNGSITLVTFRSINFLLLGAILGYVKSEKIRINQLKETYIIEKHEVSNL